MTQSNKPHITCESLRRLKDGECNVPHRFCSLLYRNPSARRMCRNMHRQLWTLAQTQGKPFVACCPAAGKEVIVPFKTGADGKINDAAVFWVKSLQLDDSHLRNLALHLAVSLNDVLNRWRQLDDLTPEYAKKIVDHLGKPATRRRLQIPRESSFDSRPLLAIAEAYSRKARDGATFFQKDVRVFRMIEGLRSLSGVKAVNMLYISRGSAAEKDLVRFFSRNLDCFLPLFPPIHGLCAETDLMERFDKYSRKYAEDGTYPRQVRPRTDTLATSVLRIDEPAMLGDGYLYTFTFNPPQYSGDSSNRAGWVGSIDVLLKDKHLRRADVAKECLLAASEWDTVRDLISQFAYYLDDPTIDERGTDWWKAVVSSLHEATWRTPFHALIQKEDPLACEVQKIVRWLATHTKGRQSLSSGEAQEKCARLHDLARIYAID